MSGRADAAPCRPRLEIQSPVDIPKGKGGANPREIDHAVDIVVWDRGPTLPIPKVQQGPRPIRIDQKHIVDVGVGLVLVDLAGVVSRGIGPR